jgi:hypothetical protein
MIPREITYNGIITKSNSRGENAITSQKTKQHYHILPPVTIDPLLPAIIKMKEGDSENKRHYQRRWNKHQNTYYL